MKNNQVIVSKSERGSMTILAGVSLVGMIAFGAVVIDTGHMLVTQADLQNVADVSADSATLELGRLYQELGKTDPGSYTLTAADEARILESVNRVAESNRVAGDPITINGDDLTYGRWAYADDGMSSEIAFEETTTGPTSVSVRARRDEVANGPVTTLLASAIGMDSFDVSARASSALTPLSTLPAGRIELPVGVSNVWFQDKKAKCGTDALIKFYPTGTLEGCAGWHTFESWSANASKLKHIIEGIKDGAFESPEVVVGETQFVFIGGTITTALEAIKDLFDERKDEDGEWRVQIPVYDDFDCSNPSGLTTIVGIATVVVTSVDAHGGDKSIDGKIACTILRYGKGGGPDYGTYLAFPSTLD